MGLGICNIQSAAHQRNAGLIRLQRTAVRRDVDAHGISRHRNKSHLHQIVADGLFHLETVRRGIASSHDRQQQVFLQKGAVALIKQQHRRIHNGEQLRRIRLVAVPENGQAQLFAPCQHFFHLCLAGLADAPQRMFRQVQCRIGFRLLQHLHRFLG